MTGPYDDIIGLPHHVSATRAQMSLENRAAQFAPFAALTGYNDAIRETARLTDEKLELDDEAIAELEMKIAELAEMGEPRPEVSILHFRPDTKKSGGAYITTVGRFKRFDEYERCVVLTDGIRIGIADILKIDTQKPLVF